MGSNESVQQNQETPKIRSSSSYYGQNTELGDLDNGNIEETIRDLQLERLYKRNPDLRPKDTPSEPTYQLKTVLSISDPPPFLKVYDNFSIISFGLKSEAPGRITLITSSNEISSLEFDQCDRTSISIPLPSKENFLIDITPDLTKLKKPISKSYIPVIKHELRFKFIDQDDGTQKLLFEDKKLQTEKNSFTVTVGKNVPKFEEEARGNCLICNKNLADTAVGSCGHNVICKDCLTNRHVRLHHCPICGAFSVV